jgi:hypothetical protein
MDATRFTSYWRHADALGVLPEVAEKCLNHTEESRVKRTYQR